MTNITTSRAANGSIILKDIHSLCVVEMDTNRTKDSVKVTVNPPLSAMTLGAAKEFAEVMKAVLEEAERSIALNDTKAK